LLNAVMLLAAIVSADGMYNGFSAFISCLLPSRPLLIGQHRRTQICAGLILHLASAGDRSAIPLNHD